MPKLLKVIKADLLKVPRDVDGKVKRKLSQYTKLSLAGQLDTKYQYGTKSVTYSGNIKSETDPSDMYRVTIQFLKLEFNKSRIRKDDIEVKVSPDAILPDGFKEGEIRFMPIPKVAIHPVRLKCACPDFRFYFEKQLYDSNSLIGNWRKYKRKTSPKVRPTRPSNPNPEGADFKNPDDYMGMCKHVYSFLVHLRNKGLVKER